MFTQRPRRYIGRHAPAPARMIRVRLELPALSAVALN